MLVIHTIKQFKILHCPSLALTIHSSWVIINRHHYQPHKFTTTTTTPPRPTCTNAQRTPSCACCAVSNLRSFLLQSPEVTAQITQGLPLQWPWVAFRGNSWVGYHAIRVGLMVLNIMVTNGFILAEHGWLMVLISWCLKMVHNIWSAMSLTHCRPILSIIHHCFQHSYCSPFHTFTNYSLQPLLLIISKNR